jgi:hypothetical protein
LVGARVLILSIVVFFCALASAETEDSRRLRQDIRSEAYNYFTRNPAIKDILHYPNGPSHPRFPCADFVSWILEATTNFPKRPADPLIVVQARSNYKYVIQNLGWEIVGTYNVNKLPTTFEGENPRPQGCLAYFYKRSDNMRPINIRHVGVIYLANSGVPKIIDASGWLGGIQYRDMNDPNLVVEGNYAKVQFVCPPL